MGTRIKNKRGLSLLDTNQIVHVETEIDVLLKVIRWLRKIYIREARANSAPKTKKAALRPSSAQAYPESLVLLLNGISWRE
jgi:hypothetical protein